MKRGEKGMKAEKGEHVVKHMIHSKGGGGRGYRDQRSNKRSFRRKME